MKNFERKVIHFLERLIFTLNFLHNSNQLDTDSHLDFRYEHSECGQCGVHKGTPWPELCQVGRHQSPIDLPAEHSQGKATILNVDRSSYNWKKFRISNNGHTIVLRMTEHTDSTQHFFEDHHSYVFSRAHFHWGENNSVGSEHTIGGKQYAMEMHLVHYSDQYSSLAEAGKDVKNRLALSVIGIFFDAADDHPNSPVMKTINDHMPLNYDPQGTHIIDFDLRDILPKRGSTFYRYAGSLTTPGCGEIVNWIVFTKPIKISTQDMMNFRKVNDSNGCHLNRNYRAVQHPNLRLVEFMKIE